MSLSGTGYYIKGMSGTGIGFSEVCPQRGGWNINRAWNGIWG